MHSHHHHVDGPAEYYRYLCLALLAFIGCPVEFVAGVITGSQALQTDALHTLSDGIESLLYAWVACRAATQPHSDRVRRLGFVFGSGLILGSTGVLAWGAGERLWLDQSYPLAPWTVAISAFALGLNVIMWRIHMGAPHQHRNLTHWGQRLHIAQDIGISVVTLFGVGFASFTPYAETDAYGTIIIAVAIWARVSYALYQVFVRGQDLGHSH